MITDGLWKSVADDGMLCIGCLEQRLARELRPEDFTRVPLNGVSALTGSARIQARLGS